MPESKVKVIKKLDRQKNEQTKRRNAKGLLISLGHEFPDLILEVARIIEKQTKTA